MTTFQGQPAKRRSKKKNFEKGDNQVNAIFVFVAFQNHRPTIFVISHLQVSQIPKITSKK